LSRFVCAGSVGKMKFLFAAFCLICLLPWSADAKTISGQIRKENTQWEYLGKFVFQATSEGQENTFIHVQADEDFLSHRFYASGQKILLYHETDDGFPMVWGSQRSCQYKVSKAKREIKISDIKKGNIYNWKTWQPTQVIPRWWYIAIANCDNDPNKQDSRSDKRNRSDYPVPIPVTRYGISATYKIVFRNGDSKFRGHFNSDETGIFEACIVFFCVLLLLVGMYGFSFYKLTQFDSGNMARSVILIGLSAVTIHFFANIFALAHYDAYSTDGTGLPSLFTFVLFLEQVPEIIIITLCLYVAKGIFTSAVEIQSNRGIMEVVVVYSIVVVTMLAWALNSENDVVDNDYLETPAGVVLMVARFVILTVFLTTIYERHSLESLEVKRRFYKMFAVFGVCFFLTTPVAYMISSTVYDYHRKKTDYICQQTFDLLGYFGVLFFFGTGKGGFVKSEAEIATGGHTAITTHDEDETQI